MKTKILIPISCMLILFLIPGILAATATISQSGADSGTVMKGEAFTLAVSDLSGSGTVSINPPAGFEIPDEDKVQSFSEGTTSVSFTTISATEKMTGQTLTAQISIAGSPSTATTSTFSVVLPPALSLTASPTSKNVTDVESFDLSISIQNTGETTAQGVSASISLPSGLTTSESSEKSVGSISASSSTSVGWTITVGTPASSSDIEITIDSSNADSETVTIPITYEGEENNQTNRRSSGGSGTPVNITGKTYIITDQQLSAGTSRDLKAGDGFNFTINNLVHSLKLVSFTQTTATIQAASTPQTATLSIGGEKKFELTGDNYYDLYTKFEGINYAANTTNLTIRSIHEEFKAAEVTPPATTAPQTEVTGEQDTGKVDATPKKSSLGYLFAALIVLVLIILVVIILVVLLKKDKKKKIKRVFL
jgi:uncharacterized repeat protein (TIGR01451 family)